MAKQVLIQFDSEVTPEQQAFFDKVAELALEVGLEPMGFGGGIKNQKPKVQS